MNDKLKPCPWKKFQMLSNEFHTLEVYDRIVDDAEGFDSIKTVACTCGISKPFGGWQDRAEPEPQECHPAVANRLKRYMEERDQAIALLKNFSDGWLRDFELRAEAKKLLEATDA